MVVIVLPEIETRAYYIYASVQAYLFIACALQIKNRQNEDIHPLGYFSPHSPISQRTLTTTESNPQVMTHLAHTLGLSPSLSFHDVYSLTEPSLLATLPRPCHALLFTFPASENYHTWHKKDEQDRPTYTGPEAGKSDPILWFKQTIRHACGLIGLLHCVLNGSATQLIEPKSLLADLLAQAPKLNTEDRAQLLYDNEELERAHTEAGRMGQSEVPPIPEEWDDPNGYVAFVKGKDGALWELVGWGKGPVSRGDLGEEDDLLSQQVLNLGPLTYMKREEAAGDKAMLGFGCLALCPSGDMMS